MPCQERITWLLDCIQRGVPCSAHVSCNNGTHKLTMRLFSGHGPPNFLATTLLCELRKLALSHIVTDKGHRDSRGTSMVVMYARPPASLVRRAEGPGRDEGVEGGEGDHGAEDAEGPAGSQVSEGFEDRGPQVQEQQQQRLQQDGQRQKGENTLFLRPPPGLGFQCPEGYGGSDGGGCKNHDGASGREDHRGSERLQGLEGSRAPAGSQGSGSSAGCRPPSEARSQLTDDAIVQMRRIRLKMYKFRRTQMEGHVRLDDDSKSELESNDFDTDPLSGISDISDEEVAQWLDDEFVCGKRGRRRR
eukprot:TRINITY_DN59378_c0_g1_i1.p1 TRINITY_DN59378_c0_g1~~TRINITY_DN59378_c0_g1_i1.p1  ORF type:complete len:329 (-),score=21.22 TRINITY_DN59378_c0_g1_i1:385-1293(-)